MDMTAGFAVPKPEKRVKGSGRRTGNKYKDRARAQENRVAVRLTERTGIPFHRVYGSGAYKEAGLLGDVVTTPAVRIPSHRWLLELKNREKYSAAGAKQVTIYLKELEQACVEAGILGNLPALIVQFTDDTRYWTTVELTTFERLLKEHREMTEIIESLTTEEEDE